MAYCYPRGKVWYVGFRDDSRDPPDVREKTKILIGRTKTEQRNSEFEALKFAREKEEKAWRVATGMAEPDVQPMPFDELCKKYLDVGASAKKSVKTIEGRVRRHIVAHFGGKASHLVSSIDVDVFLGKRARGSPCPACEAMGCDGKNPEKQQECAKKSPCGSRCHRPLSPQSCRHLRNHLRKIFKFAKKLKAVREPNPVAGSEPVEVPGRMPRVFPADSLGALLAAAGDDVRGIFAVGIFTGLRKGEILGIRVMDVQLDRRLIMIPTTKTNQPRPVAIPEGLVPYLKVELGRAKSELLFPNAEGKGRTPDWKLTNRVRTAMKSAGIIAGWDHKCRTRGQGKGCGHSERHADDARRPCPKCGRVLESVPVPLNLTFKDLRSTFATLAYEETDDAKYVQHTLGHGDPRTTDRYVRMRPKQLIKQAATLKLFSSHKQLTREEALAQAALEPKAKTK